MASLFKRNNGIFYIVRSGKHKRVWKSLHTRDIVEAQTFFDVYKREHEGRLNYRLSMFMEDFQLRMRLSLAPGTIKIHVIALKNFIRICGDKSMRSVTPYDVEKYKMKRSSEVRPVTININLRSLRASFNDAKKLNFIDENPFQGMRLVRIPHQEAAYLSQGEFRKLIVAINDPNFRNLVIFAASTMMRRGELINLRWSDIDFERQIIHVRSREDFCVKGGKPRVVPMTAWVYSYLSDGLHTGDYVFLDIKDKPFHPSTITRKFKHYIRKANLNDKIHFHSLRHTGISLLINRGVAQVQVQRIAGHSSLLTTDIYTHVEVQTLCNAINQMPSLN
jgi:integrase